MRIKGYTYDGVLVRISRFSLHRRNLDCGKPCKAPSPGCGPCRVEDEGWQVRKDGSRFWATSTLTAIRGSGGDTTGYVKVTHDITDRKLGQDAFGVANSATNYTPVLSLEGE